MSSLERSFERRFSSAPQVPTPSREPHQGPPQSQGSPLLASSKILPSNRSPSQPIKPAKTADLAPGENPRRPRNARVTHPYDANRSTGAVARRLPTLNQCLHRGLYCAKLLGICPLALSRKMKERALLPGLSRSRPPPRIASSLNSSTCHNADTPGGIRVGHDFTSDENRRVRLNYELLEPMFDPAVRILRIVP